ncbi:MAG TPA: phasin family protein [Acetobacteraceae bacterium]|jgi:phasin family protein|nr:phasin family protein [Acetobacteraceae bacterium]
MATNQGGTAAPEDASAEVVASVDDVAATAAVTPLQATAPRRGAVRQSKAAVPAPMPPAGEAVAPSVTNEPAGGIAGNETSMDKVKASMDKVIKTAEDFVSFGQGNVEAFVRSSQIWTAGVQDLGKQFVATAQAQFDETVSTFKALTSVKSLKEAMELQSTLARNSLDKAVSETGKMTDASLKLAEQTLAPITARVTLVVEKFGRTV